MKFSKNKFEEDGYCVFDFDKKLVLESKKKILYLISSVISEKYKIKNISEKKIINLYKSKHKLDIIRAFDHVGFFPELYSFANQKQIINIVKKAGLNFPVVGFNNIGGRGGVPFLYSFPNDKKRYYKVHQDFFYLPYSINSLVLWIPLQNTNKKNGALKIVPHSHRNNNLYNHTAKDVKNNKLNKSFKEDEFVSINVNLGQALVFNSFIVHKSGSNTSNQIRMSFNVRFNDLLNKEYISRDLSFDKFPSNDFVNLI